VGRDIWLVFRRHMAISLRNPAWVIIGIMQPVLYLVLFGPLMERIVTNTPGFPPGDAWQILTPALMVQLALFGSMFAGFSLLADLRTGVLERMRVTPVSRLALLLGRVLHDMVQLLVQALLLLTLSALLFGMRAPLAGIALCLVMVALMGITLSSCSYAIALVLRSEEAFPAVLTSVSVPLLLLTGILVPITTDLAVRAVPNQPVRPRNGRRTSILPRRVHSRRPTNRERSPVRDDRTGRVVGRKNLPTRKRLKEFLGQMRW
jgi:ABC-2 type transport system permease protein